MTDSIVTLHLQAFFLGFYDYLQSNIRSKSMGKSTQRTEELFTRFMQLLEDEYHKGHEVNYYADRMNITRKYLGIIVKNKTGLTPKQIIDEYIILHLKLKMRTSQNSLKQIADEYHFSDQSALTRYFRTHVGISPQQYRLK
jgi:AraC-like DNA-binding protein